MSVPVKSFVITGRRYGKGQAAVPDRKGTVQ